MLRLNTRQSLKDFDWMDVFSLAIPLTALFGLTNLGGSSFAGLSCFTLDVGAHLSSFFACDFRLFLVVFAHRSSFPLTDAASHKRWTVGFSHIHALNEEIQHTQISSVVVHLKLTTGKTREEARTHIPAAQKRKPGAFRDVIPMTWSFPIDRFHQQQFQIIGRSEILRDAALRDCMIPTDAPFLPPQAIPVLLVIIDDSLIETTLQFF
jgi:hypothetical protein